MLRRLDWIKGCGNFDNYRWEGSLPDLQRINVIYGPNGSGKTSLAGALDGLRNAADGEGYKRLSITLEDAGSWRTTNGIDDGMFDRVHVFSEHYVERSHRFTPAEAEMNAVLTIGEKAADAEARLEDLRLKVQTQTDERDKAILAKRTADDAIEEAYDRVAQQVVDAASKAGGRYHSRSNFSTRVVKNEFARTDHSAWIELTDRDLEKNVGIINADKAEELAEGPLDVSVPVDLRERFTTALNTTPTTIILESLRDNPAATSWVDEGRHLHDGVNTCIFCGSELTDERRALIDQHFSDAVRHLQGELRTLSVGLDDIVSKVDAAVAAIPTRGLLFEDLRIRYDEPAKRLRDELQALKKWALEAKTRAESKRSNVLIEVDSIVGEPPVINGSELTDLRNEHNERVSKHDELVQAAAKAVELHYLKRAEDDMSKCVAGAETARVAVENLVTELSGLSTEIRSLESIEGDPTPSAKVLTEEVARLLGRNELKFDAVGERYRVTRDGVAAVGLSAGERTAITLVHFLETVVRFDAARGKAIVVIDDPVSSLDSDIFMGVSTYIWNEAVVKDHIAQLVLLTHNFELFRQWDVQLEFLHRSGRDKATGKKMTDLYPAELFELRSKHVTRAGKSKRSPVIAPWPPSEAARKKVRSTYHHGFIMTTDALRNLNEDDSLENRLDAQLLFPNVVRRMLETFLAFKRPEWVGDFNGAMRNSAQLLKDAGYQGDADALRLRLTRYANVFSHGETPATDTTISPDEVKITIESVFVFMDQLDHDHFVGLCGVVGADPESLLRAAAPGVDESSTNEEEV
jgi:wobble nucleotide-excising tRNase